MTKIEEIEEVVEALSKQEFRELYIWMTEKDNVLWDRQVEDDVRVGKFESLAQEVLAEYQAGLTKKI